MKPPTDTDEHRRRLDLVTRTIIGCAYAIRRALGNGFLEKVYENALAHELRKAGLRVVQQHPIRVVYDKVVVGEYVADILVEDEVIVELKVAKAIDNVHKAQCIHYLKATGLPVCLLLNFGTPRVEVKRFAHGRLFGPGSSAE